MLLATYSSRIFDSFYNVTNCWRILTPSAFLGESCFTLVSPFRHYCSIDGRENIPESDCISAAWGDSWRNYRWDSLWRNGTTKDPAQHDLVDVYSGYISFYLGRSRNINHNFLAKKCSLWTWWLPDITICMPLRGNLQLHLNTIHRIHWFVYSWVCLYHCCVLLFVLKSRVSVLSGFPSILISGLNFLISHCHNINYS